MLPLVIQIVGALLASGIALACFIVYKHAQLIKFLTNDKPHNTLPFATTSLTANQVCVVFIGLIVKAILQFIGRRSSITSIASGSHAASSGKAQKTDGMGPQLPRFSLQMPFSISHRDLVRYRQILPKSSQSIDKLSQSDHLQRIFIGSEVTSTSISCHLALLLSALSEPALLLLLAKQNCPIQPLGAVNVRNRFVIRRPDLIKAILSTELDSSRTNTIGRPKALWQSWFAIAKCLPQSRVVKRGYECDFEVKVLCLDDGEEVTVFRQVFTLLQFARHNHEVAERDQNAETDGLTNTIAPDAEGRSTFRVSGTSTLRWAQLCKDYNPIHISGFAARLFGFSSRIAHGNLIVAQAVDTFSPASLIDRLAHTEQNADDDSNINPAKVWIEVQFRRPVPTFANLEVRPTNGPPSSANFAIYNKDKSSITMQVGYL